MTALERLIEQIGKLTSERDEAQAEINASMHKRADISARLHELLAIRAAHEKEGIDIILAKLTGEYRPRK